jgi:hypothetical protein
MDGDFLQFWRWRVPGVAKVVGVVGTEKGRLDAWICHYHRGEGGRMDA